jgi:NAD(P)-dependent dehydrogenase (short-subunit alcohol dehydrogenase family)
MQQILDAFTGAAALVRKDRPDILAGNALYSGMFIGPGRPDNTAPLRLPRPPRPRVLPRLGLIGEVSTQIEAGPATARAFARASAHAINLRGVWASMKHELRQMRDQGSGAVVNCFSLGGLVGLPSRAAYHEQARRDRPDQERRSRVRPPGASASTPSARGPSTRPWSRTCSRRRP